MTFASGILTETKRDIISFSHVHKAFEFPVLVDCSFNLGATESLAILGSKGSGKSLVLRLIMGFELPDQGEVRTVGVIPALPESRDDVRDRVQMVSQSGMVLENLTMFENTYFDLSKSIRELEDVQQSLIVEGLLDMAALREKKTELPASLPLAGRRMLALVSALGKEPDCVLFDEPTAELHPILSDDLTHLIRKLKTQLRLAYVIATNDLDLTREVADKVLFLQHRNVSFFGSTAEFFQSHDPNIQRYIAMGST